MARTSTSFKRGQSGNPNGRPKGTKTLAYSVRRSLREALDEATVEEAVESLREAVCSKKSVLGALELAAKLNGELGPPCG